MEKVDCTIFLPEKVIREILLRLPIKACINSKLVCKSWYNIITDPEFSAAFNFNGSEGCRLTLLLEGKTVEHDGTKHSNYMVVELNRNASNLAIDKSGYLMVSDDVKLHFKPKIKIKKNMGRTIVSDGLIWFMRLSHTNNPLAKLIILNPMTNDIVNLELPRRQTSLMRNVRTRYELGYSRVSHKLKLLKILTTLDDQRMEEIRNVAEIRDITGGGDDEWRSLGDNVPSVYNNTSDTRAFLHGSIHVWSFVAKTIWGFNFEDEQFFSVPGPEGMIAKSHGICVTRFDSKLCLSCTFRDSSKKNLTEIWIMKEYRAKSSWVKQYVISTGHYLYHIPLIKMDSGELLMKSGCGHDELVIYHPNNQTCKTVKVPGLPEFTAMLLYNLRFNKI